MSIVIKTKLPIAISYQGKVRDTYELSQNQLLIIATDRISAFDVVLPGGIPDKGIVLTQLSGFWFEKTKHLCPNHVINMVSSLDTLNIYTKDANYFPEFLIGRSMVVHKAKRIPIEAVVRGYLSGSAWEEYLKQRSISGVRQPPDMKESQKLYEPMFTPTTKADEGHDMPLSINQLKNMLGEEISQKIKDLSIIIYEYAAEYAFQRGIIIADTKFEFGFINENISLIDEILTPDSSRFWDRNEYEVGKSQPSFDKQPVRDWLVFSGWNKEPPAPILPVEIVQQTAERYKKAYKILTGKDLSNI